MTRSTTGQINTGSAVQIALINISSIVVISSGHADMDFALKAKSADAIPYAISKAAVNVIVTKFAIELEDEGIVVLAISPGVVNTAPVSVDQREYNSPLSFQTCTLEADKCAIT